MQHPRRAWGIVASVTAVSVLLSALSALAATATYLPDSTVLTTNWTLTGGTDWDLALRDGSNATFATCNTETSDLIMGLADPSGRTEPITNVELFVRAWRGTSNSSLRVGLSQVGTVFAWGGTQTVSNASTTPTEFSTSWATDPRGGNWTWTDIQNLQGAVEQVATTGSVRVSEMWVVVTYTTDTTPPTLDSASATDATHVQVVFSEAIDPASVSAADFSIPGLTVSAVSVSGSTVTLTTSVQDDVNYTVSCAAGAVSDTAANGNTAGSANFTGIDGIAPTLVSAMSTDATHVEVVFSEPISSGSVATGDFGIPGLSVTAVSVAGSTVTLTTSTQDGIGYTLTCAAGNVSDTAGNGNTAGSDAFTGTDGIAPTLLSAASSDATHVTVVFSEPLAAGSVSAADFSIPGLTVTDASVSGSDVTLTTTVQDGIDYTLTCAGGNVSDPAGNGNSAGSDTFTGTDGIAPQIVSAVSAGTTTVDVLFSEPLSGATIAADGSDFVIGGLGVTAAVLDADGVTVHLTTDLQDGVNYTVGCLADVLTDVAGNGNASGSADFTGTDGVEPTIVSAVAVDANHVDVVFSEPLQPGSVEAGDFTIAGLTVSAAVLDADAVTVHLTTSAQTGGESYTVSCAAGQVFDEAGNGNVPENEAFLGYDTVPPTLESASAPNNTSVDVVFSEPLQGGSIQPADFTIPDLTVLAAVLDADGVTVHLTTSTQGGGTSYMLSCAAGRVLDLSGLGNLAGTTSFTGSTVTDDQPPSEPGSVIAVAGGASPTIASVSWTASTDNLGVAGYRVYRASSAAGAFSVIGTTTNLSFSDTTGVPGQDYWYSVTAFDLAGNESARVLAAGVPVTATWTIEPHDAYAANTRLCGLCHAPHDAATARDIFRPTGDEPGEMGVCYTCHDGSGAVDNIKTGATNSFSGASGHRVEGSEPAGDPSNRCSSCHGPHRDYTDTAMLPKQTVNEVAVAQADNSWCFACHDATNSWYTAGTYPQPDQPSRDATGFPVAGTFPGPATYADPVANAHATIPASAGIGREAGDCLYCHSSHRGVSAYDGLSAEFTVPTEDDPSSPAYGDFAQACFVCHGSTNTYGFAVPPTNIEQYVMAGGERSGHRIETAGGTYAVGTPLPCYECHNPHGSTRGNARLFSDELGQNLETSTAAGSRAFCFTCHTTASSAAGGDGLAYGWDSQSGTYTEASAAGKKVAGLARDAGVGENRLRLPAVTGHYRDDAQACGTCHGSAYVAGGLNVHNPSGGASNGGIACYACHGTYKTNMEDGAGAQVGTARAASVHHVMGRSDAPIVDGDYAPVVSPPAAYPTSQTDVFCVSCHTDHNNFNANKGANLRVDIAQTDGSVTSNTDFISGAGSGGICTSCHGIVQPKQGMGADQLDVGSSTTPVIGKADYESSAHNYTVTSAYGASAFSANCSKCHTDEQMKEFQSSGSPKFGTHWSSTAGILRALGTYGDAAPTSEACLTCHITAGASGADLKTVAGRDVYNNNGAAMSAASEATYDEFQSTSRHDLTKVTCANCHNVHKGSAVSPVVEPDNTYSVVALSSSAAINTYCLECHDGAAPTQVVNASTFVPYDVNAGPRANVADTWATDGHGMSKPGTPFVGRTATLHATSFNPQTGTWTNGGNSVGAPDAAVGVSPADNVFDGRQTFTFPSELGSITSATLSVRSRAAGAWGALTGITPGSAAIAALNTGTSNNWTLGAGASKQAAVNTDDGDTSYISRAAGNTNSRQGFTFTSPGIPADATNIEVSVSWVGRGTGAGTNQSGVYLRTGGVDRPVQGTQSLPATYNATPFTYTWLTNPAGGDWTPTQINNPGAAGGLSNFGVMSGGTVTNGIRVTYCAMTVSYEVPAYNDDTWTIQYTTDGTSWIDVTAPSTTSEGALTDHPAAPLDITGILTAANRANFAVRILGAVNPAPDNAGTIEWDATTLQLTYSGVDAGAVYADCRDCHEQHGSVLPKLLTTSVDGTTVNAYSDLVDQDQCLSCHRAGGSTTAFNIAQYYPAASFGTAVQQDAPIWTRFGHRTKTAGAMAAGSALPCRSCHNPHGGAGTGYMLAVRTQVAAGVDTIIGDDAAEVLAMSDAQQTPSSAENVREFCFTCHTTSDAGNSQGWNGSAMAVVPDGAQVLGISRTGGVLKLPALPNGIHGHSLADVSYSCYVCHGDDFTAADSVNVHNPASGESRGGIPCYTCHTVYRDRMEDGTGAEQGGARQLSYHHVLGSATQEGDHASGTGGSAWYPTLTTDGRQNVYCLSCHVDHDRFSPFVNGLNQRSANLRAAFSDAAATGAASDWSASGGVCLGCHSVQLTRDNANQRAESSSQYTPAITSGLYDASAHQYIATSTFTDSTTFNADCSKCHDSEIDGGGMERGASTSGFQTSGNKFSVHYSANRRILGAMGVALEEPPGEETTCYACHSITADGLKTAAGRDWYDARPMSAVSEALYGVMAGTYSHNVGAYDGIHRPSPSDETRTYLSANKHVECADCHNVHSAVAQRHTPAGAAGATDNNNVSGALADVQGISVTAWSTTRWTAPTIAGATVTATEEWQICLKCHSAYNTSMASWGGSGSLAWTDQALEFSTYNASYHPVVAGLPATDPGLNGSSRLQANDMRAAFTVGGVTYGGWSNGDSMYCSDCHAQSGAGSLGPHGSAVKWMLKGPNQAWPYDTAANNGAAITTEATFRTYSERDASLDTTNGLFCRNCHVLNGTEHTRGDHNLPCVSCHIRVPHGGRASRLSSANGSTTTYPGNLPLRYTPNGQGQNVAGQSWWVMCLHKVDGGNYSGRETCGVNNGDCGGSHDHGTLGGDYW